MNEQVMERPAIRVKKPISAEGVKAILTISVAAICLICYLLFGLVGFSQGDVGIKTTFEGWKLIGMAFGDGVRSEMIDVRGDLLEVTINYPMFITYVVIAGAAVLAAVTALFSLRYTVFSKSVAMKQVTGWASIGAGLVFLGAYVALLFNKTEVYDCFGRQKEFYNLFEIKPTVLVIVMFLIADGVVEFKLSEKTAPLIKRFLPIYGFMVVPLILIFIFNIYPMVLQTVLSFKDFKLESGVWGSEWIGFGQFVKIFTDDKLPMVILRTLYISVLRLLLGLFPSLILSICLYDMKSKVLRGIYQNIVYIPHFFSWVVVYAISFALLSPEGFINSFLGTNKNFLIDENWFLPIVLITAVWKELGWGTILYLAALSSVDPALFEAAKIDGANPWQRIWHITLPSIKNTVIFLTIMNLGNILKGAGGEQLLLFYSAVTKDQATVIDTWLIWYGMEGLDYSLGAALSFFQSAIGMVMVLTCNWISKKTCEVSMW